ncbi:unnamed protein product, partial [marine sediment metagenome]
SNLMITLVLEKKINNANTNSRQKGPNGNYGGNSLNGGLE